ncbi:MAG TPA: Ig-like domain repeat protein, partial [Mycobacteriales bacterium]|nr:Ig-like domain repeat protein [Mycobacteriales bacterium]
MLVDRVSLAGTAGDNNANGLRIKSAQDRGGLVQNVTYQNICAKDVKHAIVLNPFYDSTAGTLIPQFQNIVLRNAHFLTEGSLQLQGYDAAHPTTLTLDNVVFDHLAASDLSPSPQYTSIALGPGAVFPAALQSVSGTGVTVAGSAPAVSSGALDCTSAFPLLVGEVYLSTAAATNLKSLTLDGPASFTLNATVQPAMSQVSYGAWTGVAAPVQPVTFLENGVVVGSGTLSANGTLATATLNDVGGGTHTYEARYPGDASYPAMTFGSVTVTVNAPSQSASTTQLDAPASAQFGQAVTLSAAVTSGATGSVHFSADGASLGSAPVANGVATLAIPSLHLTVGTHSIAASYGGDATYSPSASATQLLAVAAASTTTALSLPATAVFAGAPVLLTASVASPGGVPDGNVTFVNGTSAFGTVALANGSASMRVTAGAVGELSLSAAYSGNGSYLASAAAAQTLTVVAPFTVSAAAEATLPAQVPVTITPQAGFTGRVDLSCATSSPAVTCTLSQASVDLSAPATVTVALSGNAAALAATLV